MLNRNVVVNSKHDGFKIRVGRKYVVFLLFLTSDGRFVGEKKNLILVRERLKFDDNSTNEMDGRSIVDDVNANAQNLSLFTHTLTYIINANRL